MILNIVKEHYKIKSNSLLDAKMFYIIWLLVGGRISFFILISGLFMSSIFDNDSHIDYLVPLRDEEKKLRDIVIAFLVNFEYILFFIIGVRMSVHLYGYGDMIKDNFTFILMWTIFMFVCSVENRLGVLANRSLRRIKRSIKVQVKEDIYGSFIGGMGIVVIGVMSFFISAIFFMNQRVSFLTSKQGIIVFSIIIGMYIIEIIRKCKTITVGDYCETL